MLLTLVAGTALALVLADNGNSVRLWTGNEIRNEMNENHANDRYLPGISLPENIMALPH